MNTIADLLQAEAARMFSDRHFRQCLNLCHDQWAVKQVFDDWAP